MNLVLSPRSLTIVFATALVGLVGAAAPAAAHATAYSDDDKLKFTYGSLNEPIYTFQKTGLDLGITDNATGKTISKLIPTEGSPSFKVFLVRGDQSLEMNLTEQHGKAGWYTFPYVLTEPGVYGIRFEGTINGTNLDGYFIQSKHELHEMDEIMWPKKVANQDDLEARLKTLESELATLKAQNHEPSGGNAAGLGAPLFLALALVGFVLLRRRSGN